MALTSVSENGILLYNRIISLDGWGQPSSIRVKAELAKMQHSLTLQGNVLLHLFLAGVKDIKLQSSTFAFYYTDFALAYNTQISIQF